MNAGKNTDRQKTALSAPKPTNGLLRFIEELRRRRVCRAATLYSVALWLICQVVELVYIELGLPEWTLKFVIVIGLVGLPLVLILSWVGDLTPHGFVTDGGQSNPSIGAQSQDSRRPFDCLIDCGLLIVALVIGLQLAIATTSAASDESTLLPDTIAVLPFDVASPEAEFLAQGLLADLQYVLTTEANVVVIVPRDPGNTTDGLSLGGTVITSGEKVRVTVSIIDNRTRELIWTKVFQQSQSTDIAATSRLAREIVASVPGVFPAQVSDGKHAR